MEPIFETERMRMRPIQDEDLDLLVALDSDPEVMRWISGGRPTPREEVARRFRGAPGYWAAFAQSSGEFLGWFEFRPLERPGEVELGYRLRRAAWGRGYATEGARALVHKGFAEWGIQRVVATTMAVNAASRRVLEKAGLRHVRTFFQDWPEPIAGAEHGDVEYALTREEWLAQGPRSRPQEPPLGKE